MNITKTMINRVIEARGNNKVFPCKVYGTEANAEKATEIAAINVARTFVPAGEEALPAQYIVAYVPEWDKWVGFICMSEVINRKNFTGGFLGCEEGFFKW